MTQETPSEMSQYGSTYLPATYVKFVEASGARVVPILVNQSDSEYEDLFQSLNGYVNICTIYFDICRKSVDVRCRMHMFN